MIPQETIEQVRQMANIADVIGEFVRLKKRGKNYEALCPFHTEKTPSFKVSIDKQIYHCFGCGAGGNVFTFLMEHEKMSFVEAVRYLANKVNIPIRETGTSYQRETLEKLNYAHEIALEYFQKTLQLNRYRVVLEDYLKKRRNIKSENIEFFKLGLAGEEWDGLINYATRKDLSRDDLVKAGLALHNEEKRSYFDRFRQRLMIPIFNISGKPIAFGGRTLKKGESAKYVNSPETPLYNKSNILYGLNFARDFIRETGSVIIVEGYFDFISLWQAGIKNVVASSGTAFTLQQARLLARFAEEVYLFFDADSAGQKAALRSVDSLYDASLEVKIMTPPENEDPDSVAQKMGSEKILELKEKAQGFIQFRAKIADFNKEGIIAREKIIKELKGLGDKISDPTRRTLFYTEAAQALGVDVQLLQAAKASGQVGRTPTGPKKETLDRIEFDFLSLLLTYPGSLKYIFENVSPEDFDSRKLARIYTAMITQFKEEDRLDSNHLVDKLADPEAVSLLTELASVEWPDENIDSEIKNFTDTLVKRKNRKVRKKLQDELARAEQAGDDKKANEILEQLKNFGL